jgi:hypothetical protein
MVWRQRRSRAESSVYWRQQIADWKKSGQKIRAFCSERNLTESQFHLWRRTLGVKPTGIPARSVTDPTPAFVAVSVGRKNYLFLGSDNGGTAAAVLYSVLASAKANQVEPFAYVRNLFARLSGHSPPAAAALLPDAWLTAHPEARRCWSR